MRALISKQVCPSCEWDSDNTESDPEDAKHPEIALKGTSDALEQLNQFALSLRQASVSTSASRIAKFQEKIKYTSEFTTFSNLTLQILSRKYPDIPDSLRRQLHESMMFRYTRLEYRRSHEEKLRARRLEDDALGSDNRDPTENSQKSTAVPDLATGFVSKTVEETEKTSKFSRPASGLSDTIASTLNPAWKPTDAPRLTVPPRSKPASSTVMGEASFPDPPTESEYDKNGNAVCFYCRILHSRDDYSNRGWWRYVFMGLFSMIPLILLLQIARGERPSTICLSGRIM
jgi:hypothetical protein